MKKLMVGAAILAVLALTACLVGESSHRIYLEPDGAVSWTVLEREVHSTANTEEERQWEEQQFLTEAREARHPVQRAFEALGARWVESHVLREQSPFTVWTAARFDSLEELAREILYQLDLDVELSLHTEAGVHRFVMTIFPPDDDHETRNDDVIALAEDLDAYRIVLGQGRFVEAVGFAIEEGGRVAVPVAVDEPEDSTQPLEIMLAWQD